MQYEVRRIRSQQEVDELSAMFSTAILRDTEKDILKYEYIDFSEISYPRDKGSVFVALCDGEIIGAAQYGPEYPASIEQVYVHPDHRLNGIGRRLIRSIEKLARKQGKKKISVQPAHDSYDFYIECRYKPIKDSIFMKKELKPTKK